MYLFLAAFQMNSAETSKCWINPTSSRSHQPLTNLNKQIPSYQPWSVTHITTHAPGGRTKCLTGPITVRGEPLNRFHLSVSKNHLIIAIIPQRQLQSTRGAAPTVDGRDDALVVVVPRKTRPLVSGRCPAHQYPDRLDTCWCDLWPGFKIWSRAKGQAELTNVRVLLFGQKFIKILFIRFDRESFQMCRDGSAHMLRGNHA